VQKKSSITCRDFVLAHTINFLYNQAYLGLPLLSCTMLAPDLLQLNIRGQFRNKRISKRWICFLLSAGLNSMTSPEGPIT